MLFSQSSGLHPSLYAPSYRHQLSFNFSSRNSSTPPPPPHGPPPAWRTSPPPPPPPQGLGPGQVALLGLVLALLWLVSVLGNALVVLVIHRSRRTQSTTNYFVVSMACADLLLSLGCAPFVLLQVAWGGWPLSALACGLVRYLQHLCPGVQVYVLLSICVDRFYTILFPLSFKVSREKAKRMIAASWLAAAVLLLPCFFFYGSKDGACDFFLPHSWGGVAYAGAHALFGFLAPAGAMACLYRRVVRHIWRFGADRRSVRRTTNIVPRTKVKTIKMFLVLNAVFVLSWAPFYAAQLWHPGNGNNGGGRRGLFLFTAVAWLCFSSAASKPTLYSVYNANFRRGMLETFCMSSMKCYRSNAYTITASSRVAKKNYVGVVDLPVQPKDAVYEAFDQEGKEKKLAWPNNANPPNTFV
ncbi:putative G-protein coupled receptor 19 isoform 1-T4 [Menidia menidia]